MERHCNLGIFHANQKMQYHLTYNLPGTLYNYEHLRQSIHLRIGEDLRFHQVELPKFTGNLSKLIEKSTLM